MRLLLACGVALVAVGCGGGAGLQLGDVTPQSVPTLEAERAQNPQDPTVLTRLGVAYFRANRYPDARAVLDSVVARDPQNGIAAIYRGMTAEEQGDFPAARSSYEAFVAVARSNDLRKLAQQRLTLIDRRELEYQARQALASEAQLSAEIPDSHTIAVMPFGYTGTNQDLQPLSRGMAQLVVTDLSKSRQLRVLERERMQAMLDEMHLSTQGQVDSTTAVRTGHLLRAAQIVQGSIMQPQGNLLRIDATVVNVTSSQTAPSANAADQLNNLFDIEKSLVLQLFDRMNIRLTDAERLQISQRPTQNLQAFLAWSRGLQAEDNGDFAGAQQLYDQAVRMDPGFAPAQQAATKAADLSVAASVTVSSVEASVQQQSNVETGSSGSSSTQNALGAATNGVTPGSNAPSTGGTTQTTNAPTTNGSTGGNTQGQNASGTPPAPQNSGTGTIILKIGRP